jgi:antitoxin component YwqK of YwqJK toxin-antitoxin module
MDGEADYWYENGQLYASGNYKLSEYDGIWKYWNEEGKIENEEFYENGKLKKTKEYH